MTEDKRMPDSVKKDDCHEFVFGTWEILDEDRPAQNRGEPYWSLQPCTGGFDTMVLAKGPFGRKAMEPDSVIWGVGYECDGIECSDKNMILSLLNRLPVQQSGDVDKPRTALQDCAEQLALLAKDPATNPWVLQAKAALSSTETLPQSSKVGWNKCECPLIELADGIHRHHLHKDCTGVSTESPVSKIEDAVHYALINAEPFTRDTIIKVILDQLDGLFWSESSSDVENDEARKLYLISAGLGGVSEETALLMLSVYLGNRSEISVMGEVEAESGQSASHSSASGPKGDNLASPAPSEQPDDCREAFEAWFAKDFERHCTWHGLDKVFLRNSAGRYFDGVADFVWRGFQAGLSLPKRESVNRDEAIEVMLRGIKKRGDELSKELPVQPIGDSWKVVKEMYREIVEYSLIELFEHFDIHRKPPEGKR